ncbi:MAG: MFS transporter [Candidatus Krumholzibacteriota bacterium]|nr:MFS transporter [Candidatus Krumholzibacteriota bacterium]
MRKDDKKAVFGWSMYDWAASAFATTVIAGFFPVFFKRYWCGDVDATVSTARLGIGVSLASISIALLAPVLGAIADRGSARKRFLVFFGFTGAVLTSALFFVAEGNWEFALLFYAAASIAFNGGNIFYDSLIGLVSSEKRMEFTSSLGYALGYLGGGILFALNIWMTLRPAAFGLSSSEAAVKYSFLSVGIWWALFTIPLILFVKEPRGKRAGSPGEIIKSGISELRSTFREIRSLRTIFMFLLAYWFYIDGVDTVVRMAVDYGLSIGLERNDLIIALLITQFVGFPSAMAFGALGVKVGARRGIFFAIGVYLFVSVWAAFISGREEFYLLAVVVGLVQGGIQALSRSFYAKIIPKGKMAEYFGFYNMIGKFAAIIGPVLIGGLGLFARRAGFSSETSTRIGISSISLLFITGAVLLYFVDEEKGKQDLRSHFP